MYKMAKVLPRNNGSYLVNSYKETRKALFWAKFWGWLCIPCCCMGCICLAPATVMSSMLEDLAKLIKIYTPEKLKEVAKDIDIEQDLFIQACNVVNVKATKVFPNIKLMDCLCLIDKKLESMLDYYSSSFDYFGNKAEKDAYMTLVYNTYIELGGNVNVIVFGYPEYMARFNDPTSDKMMVIFHKLTTKTQLASFVFSYTSSNLK